MKEDLKQKFKESLFSILPIMVIMLIISLILGFSISTFISLFVSSLLLMIGICLFTYGADLSMIEIGRTIASKLVKTRKPILIALVAFVVGIIVTIAEPDLRVLAEQMTVIDNWTLIIWVSIGVGLFLSIASLRIIYQIDLKIIITVFYGLILILMFLVNKEMIPFAFDSGGVTTGSMSVPLIMAMGLGFSASRSRKESKDDSFGLIALCSIGPVLIILLFSLFFKGDMNYIYNIQPEVTTFSELLNNYKNAFLPNIKEVFLSLLPIICLFIFFSLILKSFKKQKFKSIISGLILSFIGLVLFFIGVNVGYMPLAYLIGIRMYNSYQYLLIPLGIIVGLVIVKAEPAVAVLTEQIEKITQGSMSKKVLNDSIAIGVGLAITISIIRALTGIEITWFLFIGYLLAIVLMFFTPKFFTMVAFDAGGAVSGLMTTSFLLPLIIGICYQNGSNVLMDAFGVSALVALSPLLTVQALGIIYELKAKYQVNIATIDETIIEYDWKCCHE